MEQNYVTVTLCTLYIYILIILGKRSSYAAYIDFLIGWGQI